MSVDLGQFIKRDDEFSRQMRGMGLQCACGVWIEGEAVNVMAFNQGFINTPEGQQMGLRVVEANFHSRECPVYLNHLENLKKDPSFRIVERARPAVTWVRQEPLDPADTEVEEVEMDDTSGDIP